MLNWFDLKLIIAPYMIYFCCHWRKIILTIDFHLTEKEGLRSLPHQVLSRKRLQIVDQKLLWGSNILLATFHMNFFSSWSELLHLRQSVSKCWPFPESSKSKTELRHLLLYTHCAKDLLTVKKIQPNLIPLKTITIGCVDLNSKIKFTICHWTLEIGYIWQLQRKSGCFVGINIW